MQTPDDEKEMKKKWESNGKEAVFVKSRTRRNTVCLVGARMISDVGNWIDRIAVLTLAAQATGAASSTSFVSILTLLPYILFSPLAGKVADRFDQKKILIFGDLLRAVFVFCIPLFPDGMLFFLFLVSLVSTFTDVCSDSIVPFLVEETQLKHVNSIDSSMSSLIMVVGPSLSGVLLAFLSVEVCFYIDSASFLLSALLLLGLSYHRTPAPASRLSKEPEQKDTFFETLRYVRAQPKLLSVTVTIAAVGLAAGMLNSLLILYVYNYMHQNSAGYGAILSAKGVAMLLASAVLYKLLEKVSCERLFNVSLLGLGLSLLLFPLNTVFAIGMLIQAANGVFNAGYAVARVTLVQTTAAPERLGRVFSVNSLLSNILSITSLGVFGLLADEIGVRTVLLIGGGIVTAAAGLSFFLFRKKEA